MLALRFGSYSRRSTFAGDAVLVAAEVDHAVVLLVPAALVARRDVARVVAAGALALRLDERRVRPPLCRSALTTLTIDAAAGRGRFDFDECHAWPPLPRS